VSGAIMAFPHLKKLQYSQFLGVQQKTQIYKIEKRPKLRNRQGEYAVVGIDGQILKRGQDLKSVLGILERKLIKLVD
jgi:hypothetical protein